MTLQNGLIALGDVRYDPERRIVIGPDDAPVSLRPQSLDVLHVLASSPGEVIAKDALIEAVWKDLNVTDDSLTQCIADIRRAIGDGERTILQTVPKQGYRLQVVETAAGSRIAVTALTWLAAGVVCLAVALLAVWQFRTPPKDDSPLFQTLIAPQVVRSGPSIAVLPFVSIQANERWKRLGRGLAMDIASELSLNDWLYVTVPESLRNVAGGLPPPAPVLDVRFALGGTIQAEGEEIRISAHLTDATTREILWSETWTEPQDSIFAVQDHIIARIGGSLASTYSGAVARAELKRVKRKLTDDLDAYEHYLLGYEQLHRWNPDEIADTIAHLEAAVEIDPNFAGALVTLSVAQFIRSDYVEGDEAKRWIEASQDSAYRAHDLDPDNPNVLWNLARAYALDGQLDLAGTTLRQAVKLAPNNADVLMISAGYSDLAGIPGSESLDWTRRALELNPMAPAWWYSDLGAAAYGAGDYELAVQSMKRAPPKSTSRWLLTALAQVHLGNLPEAKRAARKVRDLVPQMTIEQFAGGTEASRPDQHHMFEAARQLGLPITAEDLRLMNRPAIVVLPFENLSSDARWNLLSRALASDIADDLARNEWLHVTAPKTAIDIGADADATQTGRDLGVRFVLSGTVQADAGTLRISARLIDAATGSIVWSNRWVRPEANLFEVQDDILSRIDTALASSWSSFVVDQQRAKARLRPTENLTAWELFHLGTEQKNTFTRQGLDDAEAYFKRALALDPGFGKAWALLGYTYIFKAAMAQTEAEGHVFHDLQMEAARRAIEASPDDPLVQLLSTTMHTKNGDFPAATQALERVLEVAPNNADALALAAWFASGMADFGDAPVEWVERAISLNPRYPKWYSSVHGIALFHRGYHERATEVLANAARNPESLLMRSISAARSGDLDLAREIYLNLQDLVGGRFTINRHIENSGYFGPKAIDRIRAGGRLAGIPVTDEDLRLMNTPAIAVLQLEDLTGDARWQRIGRGMSADIANELARNKSLYVTAPGTALATVAPPVKAGRALKVRYVLDGTLQAEGDDLRVMARLTDAATGAIVWSQRWTRHTDDIFAVQDEIVAKTGASLASTWTGVLPVSKRAAVQHRASDNLDAYYLTLLGAEEKLKLTEQGFANAARYLSQALAIDPDNVPALATLSVVKLFHSHAVSSPEQSKALLQESFDFARKAYAIDPSHPEALLRMGDERTFSGDPRGAFRYVKRAVDAAPNNADILAAAGWIGGVMGSESPLPYEWARRAIALNPNHPDWYLIPLGISAFYAGDIEASVASLGNATLDAEGSIILSVAVALQGDLGAAKVAASKFRDDGTFASLSDFWGTDLEAEPLYARLVEGARLAGFPINSRDIQSQQNAEGPGAN